MALSKKIKIGNLLLGIMFTLFAIVQYNDPDPIRWILLYSVAAISCFLFSRGVGIPILDYAGVAICLFGLVRLLPKLIEWIKMGMPNIAGSMKAETPYIEFTREFLGLLLAGLVFFWHTWYFIRHLRRRGVLR